MIEIELTDPALLRDPFAVYARVREQAPLVRLSAPGFGEMWALTRHADARAMLGDPRFELTPDTFGGLDVAAEYQPYLRNMQVMNGQEHLRLRRLVAPAFTARRAAEFRPRIERLVDELIDGLPGDPADPVDLVPHFARPLPMDVICELVGIPPADRPRWRTYGVAVAAGLPKELTEAVPGLITDARSAVARRRAEPADDLVSDLVRARDEDGDRLSETELITMIWTLVLGGQTPANLIANAVLTLLDHPDQLAALRAEPGLMPSAVEELTRWAGPQLMTLPRFAREDLELVGTPIAKGDRVTASIVSVNRDPRTFPDPDRLDIARIPETGHLGFAHGPHFCLGAALARVQTDVALTAILRRFPNLKLAEEVSFTPDPGTLRVTRLPLTG